MLVHLFANSHHCGSLECCSTRVLRCQVNKQTKEKKGKKVQIQLSYTAYGEQKEQSSQVERVLLTATTLGRQEASCLNHANICRAPPLHCALV